MPMQSKAYRNLECMEVTNRGVWMVLPASQIINHLIFLESQSILSLTKICGKCEWLFNLLTMCIRYKPYVVHMSKSQSSLDNFRHMEQGGGDLEGRQIEIHCNPRSFENWWHFTKHKWYGFCGARSFWWMLYMVGTEESHTWRK